MATPIVMAPQAAILGVHRAIERPWVVGGNIVVRTIMNISVTFDHRVMDGMTAAKFNQEIVALLEHPALLFYEP
jgi:2-oxoisovalerate dehydrogenase E2 component (dihydrolipoyl transacylase)